MVKSIPPSVIMLTLLSDVITPPDRINAGSWSPMYWPGRDEIGDDKVDKKVEKRLRNNF